MVRSNQNLHAGNLLPTVSPEQILRIIRNFQAVFWRAPERAAADDVAVQFCASWRIFLCKPYVSSSVYPNEAGQTHCGLDVVSLRYLSNRSILEGAHVRYRPCDSGFGFLEIAALHPGLRYSDRYHLPG
ncbi:hypothetical protein D3C71_1697740 [compost metagenome]